MIDTLSVFFPAYNEEANLENTVVKTQKILQKNFKNWEILIINDGSKDKTPEIANKLAKSDKHIRVIHHSPNKGYGAALTTGFYEAKYPWVAFSDSDGQFDFSEITKFIDKQDKTGADVVIGYYLERQVPKSVILTSKIWEIIIFILFGLHVRDIDCAFKLVSKKAINAIPHLESQRGAFITSELLIKVKKNGFKIAEVGVHHFARAGGKATGRNIKVIIKSFTDLFRLWLKLQSV